MVTESIERRQLAAKSRNKTFVIHFRKSTGNDLLEFLDECKTDAELEAMKRYWKKEGYSTARVYDLWSESHLQRVRRLRNKGLTA